jgi:hypothetical protein
MPLTVRGTDSGNACNSPDDLIDKGLVYTTSHGAGEFTVPQFDRYMRRNHDLAPPARRREHPPRRELACVFSDRSVMAPWPIRC